MSADRGGEVCLCECSFVYFIICLIHSPSYYVWRHYYCYCIIITNDIIVDCIHMCLLIRLMIMFILVVLILMLCLYLLFVVFNVHMNRYMLSAPAEHIP